MNSSISIREYSELKLEIVRLKAELEAQKMVNDQYRREFQALLRETSDRYTAEINQLKGIPPESQTPVEAIAPPALPVSPPASVAAPPAPASQENSLETTQPPSSASACTTPNAFTDRTTPNACTAYTTCIRETTKKSHSEWDGTTYKNQDIKRCILSALQHNNLEEYIYIVLEPILTEKKCKAVSRDVHIAMLQAFFLLSSFDLKPLFQRVELFASIQFFLVTRFASPSLLDVCMDRLQDIIQTELKRTRSITRFPPWYVATVLMYYDLCRRFDCVELFKSVLFTLLLRAGEFPLHLLNAVFKFDPAAFSETTTCDMLVNAIVGSVLHSIKDLPVDVADMASYYAGINSSWEDRVTEIEKEVLQCVLDEEDYAQENAQYVMAGKCLVLIYAYKGGQYAVESLVNNGIIERIDDPQYLADYRTFLVYVVLWIAETNLFGGEWTKIRRGLLKVDVCTSAIQKEFASLFQWFCLLPRGESIGA